MTSKGERYDKAVGFVDKMVRDYRNDMAKWAGNGKPARTAAEDASEMARVFGPLVRAQPHLSAWLLAIAIQRLGDEGEGSA